jgi:hypothetical protein
VSGPLKRFVDSLRGLFSNPENDGPLDRMSDIEPEGVEDSTESEGTRRSRDGRLSER